MIRKAKALTNRLGRVAVTAAVVLAVGVASCSDQRTVSEPLQANRPVEQRVAYGIAAALADANVRSDVRDVMRSSLKVSHKVTLQELVQTEQGQALVLNSSRALRLSRDEFLSMVQSLPSMDISVPSRSQRLAWRATADLVVAATMDNDKFPASVFNPGGEESLWASRDAAAVLFLIEPTENNDRRINPQPAVAGFAIQDAEDGDGGGAWITRDSTGKVVSEVQLADIAEVREAMRNKKRALFHTSGGVDTTYVGHFWTDALDGAGSLEIEFRASFFPASGQGWFDHTLRKDNIDTETHYYDFAEFLVLHRILDGSSQSHIDIDLVETDAFSDDQMGTRSFYWGDNGDDKSFQGSGDNSTVALEWTPTTSVGSTGYSATIYGPSAIRPSTTCWWTASSNVADASQEWFVGGTSIGTGTTAEYSSSIPFELELQVWNSSGGGASTTLAVSVDSNNGECFVEGPAKRQSKRPPSALPAIAKK